MARLMFTSTGGCAAAPDQRSTHPVPCNPALQRLAQARRVLLLQGPVGPFFDRLTRWLVANGASVHRVAFQAGDLGDCRTCTPIRFEGGLEDWPAFFSRLLGELGIDAVVLFGQSRKHHSLAIRQAKQAGVAAIVLEEGYVRPGFLTMELDGVNGLSHTLDVYRWDPDAPGLTVHAQRPARRDDFWKMAGHACRHYWHQYWGAAVSPKYQHHRSTDIWHHSRYWVWSWVHKQVRMAPDAARVRWLPDRPDYFVPLQHEGDSQITHHSPYPEIKAFIHDVLISFAAHGPQDAQLVFKTHPHARGGPSYRRFIRRLARELGIQGRVLYLVEGHTPTLVEHADGVVLINSTVGVQALARRKPLAVLGHAIYKRPGLFYDGALDDFWTEAPPPDDALVGRFLEDLVALTQAPCRVYADADEPLLWKVESRT